MIYICTHLDKPAYNLNCEYQIIKNDSTEFKNNIAETGNKYRHLRGIYNLYKNYELPDEIGIFQQKRYLGATTIPEGYDIVVPKPFFAWQIYAQFNHHHNINDLNLVRQIINDKSFDEYLFMNNNLETYWDNMFIMKKDDFNKYCEFLFDVLFEFDKKTNYENDGYPYCAYLGERIGSYWIYKNIDRSKIFLADRLEVS